MFDFFKNKERKKVGLVLGSGGFRGPAHIAIIKTLVNNGIPIDYIVGCSIGSMVGAHYALFQDVTRLEKDLLNQQNIKLSHLRDLSFKQGLLSGKTFEKSFLKMYEGKSFSDTKIPLSLIATDLTTGKPYIFKDGDIALAVRASISIPFTFKPIKKGKSLLVDGGISAPVPDFVVKDMGADIIISANLYHHYELNNSKLNLTKSSSRSLEVLLTNISNLSASCSDIIINPDTSKYSEISRLKSYFDKKIALDIMKIAEKETLKAIPAIRKLLG
ncbi:MAG TPA: patatin-like phospholipase family protein [bacterium]|nr:patatin-like phospholipase family protein [bacterium]